jgi:hypothetical protein
MYSLYTKRGIKSAYRKECKYLRIPIKYMAIARISDHVPVICSSIPRDDDYDQYTFLCHRYCSKIINMIDYNYLEECEEEGGADYINVAFVIENLSVVCYLYIDTSAKIVYATVTNDSLPPITSYVIMRELDTIVKQEPVLCQRLSSCGYADLTSTLLPTIRHLCDKHTRKSVSTDENEHADLLEEMQNLSIVSYADQF